MQTFVEITDPRAPHTVFATEEHGRDGFIGSFRVTVQEHVGAPNLAGWMIARADDLDQFIPFCGLEMDFTFGHVISISQPRKIFKLRH